MAGRAFYDKDYEFEIALQIGGKKFPEYPLTSQAETFAALKNAWAFTTQLFILWIFHQRNTEDINIL